ncbi:hypothetical protein Glove_734g16 [Diversispora epigaea]|uniref:Uncharacterized protein n=1 Tax=Diversispora epigaea TaxID=1348612 RepID=A0A397G3E7_9GLOM|nr:hypothetical protein Glove_734g16 [Diversispora epigaea]
MDARDNVHDETTEITPNLINPKLPSLDDKKITPSSSNDNKCSWRIIYSYARFIDYRELQGFTKKGAEIVEGHIKRPTISSVKNGFQKLDDYLVQPKRIILRSAEEEYQPIDDENALVKGANIVIEKMDGFRLEELRKDLSTLKHNQLKNVPYVMLNMKKINSISIRFSF